MIDNFDKIMPLLTGVWDTYTYPISFHVQVLQRRKDGHQIGHNNQIRTIAEWYIHSENRLSLLKPAIASLCDIYDARCYIAINGKSDNMVLWGLIETAQKDIKNNQMSFKGMIAHVHDTCNGHGTKRWIIDVDDPTVNKSELYSAINNCRSSHSITTITEIPTKNGYHIITNPFDLSQLQLPSGVEVKKNNSTLLYY